MSKNARGCGWKTLTGEITILAFSTSTQHAPLGLGRGKSLAFASFTGPETEIFPSNVITKGECFSKVLKILYTAQGLDHGMRLVTRFLDNPNFIRHTVARLEYDTAHTLFSSTTQVFHSLSNLLY
jgi:hypothetical protein